jgi:hypothetical protein
VRATVAGEAEVGVGGRRADRERSWLMDEQDLNGARAMGRPGEAGTN